LKSSSSEPAASKFTPCPLRAGRRTRQTGSFRGHYQRDAHEQDEQEILRRGPDQGDVSAFDVGQKRILLGFVEPMDFIHKDGRTPMRRAFSAPAMISFISLMPARTALKGTNVDFVTLAMICASAVLPTPGVDRARYR
jgi:hypothetical protein